MKKSRIVALALVLVFCSILSGCNIDDNIDNNDEIYSEVYEKGMIETHFLAEEIVYADYIITKADADPSGVKDSTAGIKKVLKQCSANGGGTVFLPRGKYRVTSNIAIPSFVYLKGEYNDPDGANFDGNYGTVILADVAPSKKETRQKYMADKNDQYANFPALFTVGGSSGIDGLTIYYPKQSPSKITPYPFAIEIPSFAGVGGSINHMASTVKNITFINTYKGICASVTPAGDGKSAANEVLHIENVKGTALYQGLQLYNSSETGIVRDINFSNNYWFTASGKYASGNLTKLDEFTKTYSTGILLGDLEWDTFTNINVSGYRIGIRFFDGLRRYIPGQPEIYFIGQFYGVNILDCMTGVRVDNLFDNMGVTFANGVIEGSAYAINDCYSGSARVRLIGIELRGNVKGDSVYVSGGEDKFTTLKNSNLLPNTSLPTAKKVNQVEYNATRDFNANNKGRTDTSSAIQQALDTAGNLGGGVVYLSAGFYRVARPLTIPANVELRGSASMNTRDQRGMSAGTVIFADFGYNSNDSALITITGDCAGVSGIRFAYPKNPPLLNGNVSIREHSYVIRATKNDNYVKYCSFVGVDKGIEFRGTSKLVGGIVKGVNGTYYKNGINAVNAEVVIEECLSNAAVLARHNFVTLFAEDFANGWVEDGPQMAKIYDQITRPNSKFITCEDSKLSVSNSFTFASFSVLGAKNSDVTMFNCAGDNLALNGELIRMDGGNLTAINIMRFQGAPLVCLNNANCTILNRLSLHMNKDNDLVNGVEKATVRLKNNGGEIDDLPPKYNY